MKASILKREVVAFASLVGETATSVEGFAMSFGEIAASFLVVSRESGIVVLSSMCSWLFTGCLCMKTSSSKKSDG